MFEANTTLFILGMLLVLVFSGIHIAVALVVTSIIGIYLVVGDVEIVVRLVQTNFHESIRDYIFAVIPLFMLMGEFVGRSGVATDLYQALQAGFRRLPGRLAIATLLGNAIFSFVTGVSIASAAAFTRLAYPEMVRHSYNKGYALGSIAGSGVLGMLIPPSVLMIIWGILSEQSIGALFLAGVLPGFVLVGLFGFYIVMSALIRPALAGGRVRASAVGADVAPDLGETIDIARTVFSGVALLVLITSVLGGIWGGIFTPTEAAGIGALISLLIAFAKGMRLRDFYDGVLSVGRTAAPILVLLIAASLYSRTLTLTGVLTAIQDYFAGTGLEPWQVLLVMFGVWFLLGMIIDSASIMFLTVPVFFPIATALGIDPLGYAIIGILAIEAGLLTPPFGLLVYTVKASVPADDPVTMLEIFAGSTPYWLLIVVLIALIFVFPGIASYLPNLVFG
jgi:tripartite ATP-independent transporter DctM subunit